MPRPAKALYCAAALTLALPVTEALAEESLANLDAGGLIIEPADQLELKAEDIFLSARQVRGAYRFLNKASQDLTLTVAFPLPEVTGEADLDLAIPNPGSPNFLNVQARAAGKPVETSVEQHAFFTPDGGKESEITDLLKGFNIPLLPAGASTAEALKRLSSEDRAKLSTPGYIEQAGENWVPLWTLRSRIVRQQALPAGKEIVLQYSYTPSVGSAAGLYFDRANLTGESLTQYQKKYCVNEGFLRAADALTKRLTATKPQPGEASKPPKTRQTYFGYAFVGGGRWAAPAGRFGLVIDKAFPDNLVSFCADGAKKVSSTRYELKRNNYAPDRNLDILILDKNVAP
ncbi:DUF4424 family protein [Labrys sp. ZIDIC5]|uniref:DUF4424 family protein n=1 Tax=Labrys sedimenti TaxID=3106036 RepID=UPI002ACAF8C4|nr:DUF4424 family protein [Labrys sp. ZIDIC5]MDZ5451844.1 DUF4424 family protein [Labrys sp. ZIDIC5]